MKFAVVAQSAGSTGLDQNIGALLQGFNITTHHTFERCTDEVRAVFCTKFNGSFCHGRWSQIFQMQTVIYNARILLNEPGNYNARAEIMWCGSLSHNGLTGCGTCGGDWATHLIEHELGGMFDVAHGAGLAAVWGSWARYVMDEKPERFAQFAVDVMGVEESDDVKSTALKGIEAVEEFYRMIEMPTNMKELGI